MRSGPPKRVRLDESYLLRLFRTGDAKMIASHRIKQSGSNVPVAEF